MIGKMFRPIHIEQIRVGRGINFSHKYKSNYGNKFEFKQAVTLSYLPETNTEDIIIEFSELEIPVIVSEEYKINDNVAVLKKENKISSLRKINRPNKSVNGTIISKKDIAMFMVISSEDNIEDNEMLEITLELIFKDLKEYIHIKVNSTSTVVIKSNSEVVNMNGL